MRRVRNRQEYVNDLKRQNQENDLITNHNFSHSSQHFSPQFRETPRRNIKISNQIENENNYIQINNSKNYYRNLGSRSLNNTTSHSLNASEFPTRISQIELMHSNNEQILSGLTSSNNSNQESISTLNKSIGQLGVHLQQFSLSIPHFIQNPVQNARKLSHFVESSSSQFGKDLFQIENWTIQQND